MQGVGINGFDLKQKYPFVRGSDVAKNAESKDSARYVINNFLLLLLLLTKL